MHATHMHTHTHAHTCTHARKRFIVTALNSRDPFHGVYKLVL